jgi:OmpA-OmpF porin, OOP family
LEQAAQILRDDGRSLRIVGHTDSSGDETKNRQLSEDRAASVRNFLVDRGVNPSSLSSYGLGSDQPLADNATEEGRAKNRRIEFKSN